MRSVYRTATALRRLGGLWRQQPYFGFIQGHSHLASSDLADLAVRVGRADYDSEENYERSFAALVGDGQAVSFAAGRMGAYAVFRALGIGAGDQVVLPGATCSVMVNAVLRAGATPRFADIDPCTFGSDASAIERAIGPRTRVVVAQHSFGVPCEVDPIVDVCSRAGVFLLEDCALTVSSTLNGRPTGSFGDAALYSTDHTKPINTLTGGLIYTKDENLAGRLRTMRNDTGGLSKAHEKRLWNRLLAERHSFGPARFARFLVRDRLTGLFRKVVPSHEAFLASDSGVSPGRAYRYPARMPSFLAQLGLGEVRRWPHVVAQRRSFLHRLLRLVAECGYADQLSPAYSDPRREIVPLRLALQGNRSAPLYRALARAVQVDCTWFREPIVSRQGSLAAFGYVTGCCPNSELMGPRMVNIPCCLAPSDEQQLLTAVCSALESVKVN